MDRAAPITEDLGQITALVAVTQHGLGHDRSHGGPKGRDDPGQQQSFKFGRQQRQQGTESVGQQTGQHGRAPPYQITEPTPADDTHGKRQKIDRQGLGRLPVAHPELGGDLGQRRAVDGLHYLGNIINPTTSQSGGNLLFMTNLLK